MVDDGELLLPFTEGRGGGGSERSVLKLGSKSDRE